MRIALDATPLTVTTGGVKRYTAELARALAEAFPDDEVWLVSDQPFEHPAPELANIRAGRGPRNSIERRWWLWGLQAELSRLAIDVFHGGDFSVPYLPVRPSVMTLHDLSPWMDPGWHDADSRVKTRTPLLLRLGLAAVIVTPSETVRRQAIERFHVNPDRIVAIPLAVPRTFAPVETNGAGRGYFLYVGTLEPRKNVPLLIDCWREVRKKHPVDLKLVGRRRDDFAELPPEPGLTFVGPVRDEQLPALYSGAIAFVYPSCYEGFGLPVLEAMQCGAAVITSRDAAIGETVGDAALRIDAGDRSGWIHALASAAEQPEWISELRRKGRLRAAQFSWKSTATRTREAYVEAIRRFRRTRRGA